MSKVIRELRFWFVKFFEKVCFVWKQRNWIDPFVGTTKWSTFRIVKYIYWELESKYSSKKLCSFIWTNRDLGSDYNYCSTSFFKIESFIGPVQLNRSILLWSFPDNEHCSNYIMIRSLEVHQSIKVIKNSIMASLNSHLTFTYNYNFITVIHFYFYYFTFLMNKTLI